MRFSVNTLLFLAYITLACLAYMMMLAAPGSATIEGPRGVAQTDEYIKGYGLDPVPSVYSLEPPYSPEMRYGEASGVFEPHGYDWGIGRIRLADDLFGIYLAEVALHETVHAASMGRNPTCYPNQGRPECERPYIIKYEEGLTEANTLHMLREYWRWLTGKTLKLSEWKNQVKFAPYRNETHMWLKAAMCATGTHRWSAANAAWLREAIAVPLVDRPAYLTRQMEKCYDG